MITGYNTDVPHSDLVFHVQTEDKGKSSAWIESLVYVGGQVVARKRSSYKSYLDEGQGRQAIAEMMDRQHRLMIAEVRGGKFDAKVSELAEGAAKEEVTAGGAANATSSSLEPHATDDLRTLDEVILAEQQAAMVEQEVAAEESVPTLDQVILEYLNSEAEQEHLVLMMDSDGDLVPGEEVGMRFQTKSSVSAAAVPGTLVAVKMISTVSSPATLAAGETDEQGELGLTIRIPDLQQGTGALIITASSKLGTAEIKQLL
ncbi:MAG: hypothetical protein EP299_04375 [Acidobacteria bacterium]|nr:MAG: hypothetical protein EP299_04375 [Acidobacteriota bacterium]